MSPICNHGSRALPLLWAATLLASGYGATIPPALRIGRPTPASAEDRATFAVLADAVSRSLHTPVEVVFAGSREALERQLQAGSVDVVITTVAVGFDLKARGLAAPLLVPVADDGSDNNPSIVFVRRDSGIRRLADLRGRTVAFEDPDSTTGYHLPLCEMTRAGLRLSLRPEQSRPGAPGGSATSYVFARAKTNAAAWVFHGRVDAAALSLRSWRVNVERHPAYRQALAEVARTISLPRQVVSIRANLAPSVALAVTAALAALGPEDGLGSLKWRRLKRINAQQAESWERMLHHCGLASNWR